VVAQPVVGDADVGPQHRVVGPVRQRTLQAFQCLRHAVRSHQHERQPAQRFRMIGMPRQRGFEQRLGAGRLAIAQGAGAGVEAFGVLVRETGEAGIAAAGDGGAPGRIGRCVHLGACLGEWMRNVRPAVDVRSWSTVS
jgi:hypothetical protein